MPLRLDPDRPVGLVLSGGGARGAFQVGVWKVLREHPRGLGRDPDVISGTSAGALNGVLIAAGLAPDDILEFWLDLADRPPVIANETFFRTLRSSLEQLMVREPIRGLGRRARDLRIFGSLLGKHRWYRRSGLFAMLLEFLMTARFDSVSALLDGIKTSYLFDIRPVRERLARAIGGDELRQTRVKLAINTVDVATGGVVRIVNHRPGKHPRASSKHYRVERAISLDMVLASAAIPLLFNPVRVGDHTLWDGGLLVNSPMAPAVALGAQRILPVLVTSRPDLPHRAGPCLPLRASASGVAREGPWPTFEIPTFGAAIERLADAFLENAYNIDRKLLLDRNRLAQLTGDPDLRIVDLYRAIRPASSALFDAGSYLFFERKALLGMYEAGQAAARAWLAAGPELDAREKEE